MTTSFADASPAIRARISGALYAISVVTAVVCEFAFPGRFPFVAVAVPVFCYAVATLLIYDIVKPVNRLIALLAVSCQLVALVLEALRFQPQHLNIGMIFHGLYCVLIGWLILRSTFLPRILGALMALAGFCWLTNFWPAIENHLHDRITALGLLGESMPMLWLLVFGVNAARWSQQAKRSGALKTTHDS